MIRIYSPPEFLDEPSAIAEREWGRGGLIKGKSQIHSSTSLVKVIFWKKTPKKFVKFRNSSYFCSEIE